MRWRQSKADQRKKQVSSDVTEDSTTDAFSFVDPVVEVAELLTRPPFLA